MCENKTINFSIKTEIQTSKECNDRVLQYYSANFVQKLNLPQQFTQIAYAYVYPIN